MVLARLVRARRGLGSGAVRQSLVALALNSTTSLVAGAFLGAIVGTFKEYPGLLVLVPAAIGLRGNIFGAMGNRMSTAIHQGTFRWSLRREAVLGQNVIAALVLTMGVSLVLAVVAKVVAVGMGLENTISVVDLSTISIVGGLLGSLVVLAAALGLTGGAVRYGWDLDNVNAPLVSTLGDVLTLPALYVATFLLGYALVSTALGLVLALIALALTVLGWRTSIVGLRQVVRESLVVLIVAGCVSAGAGVALERSFQRFEQLPALMMLVPAQLSSAGALGGILSGRLSSKLFLGLVEPTVRPNRAAQTDIWLALGVACPVFVMNGAGAHLAALWLGKASPSLLGMIGVALVGGALVMAFVVAVAYYGTIAAYRTGADPDTYGIPVVSSSVDLVGALALILAMASFGYG